MICKLCLDDTDLQRESHIIPQFMYDQLSNDDGYFYKVRRDTIKKYEAGKTPKPFQSGEYDKHILCERCENEILCHRYEDYTAKVFQLLSGKLDSFQNIEIQEYTNPNGLNGKLIKNVNYAKFKLFLLSILWRASISQRDFFRQVDLGEKHNEIIRKMIYDGNPKNIEDYPCFMCDISKDHPSLCGSMLLPRKIKDNGNTSYVFMICGIFYKFTISKFGIRKIDLAGVIAENNEMIIWEGPEGFGKEFLATFKGLFDFPQS